MSSAKKRKKAQLKLLGEMKNQLFIQADRLGIRHQYTPFRMAEYEIDAANQILLELQMERANLEYELQILGTDKKELLIKLERLQAYIMRLTGEKKRSEMKAGKVLEKMHPEERSQMVHRVAGKWSSRISEDSRLVGTIRRTA